MKQYTKKEFIDIVVNGFQEATENVMNGETPINAEFYSQDDGEIGVGFDIDLGRAGFDTDGYVGFKDGKVYVGTGEYLESCGVADEVEENLQYLADELKDGAEITSEFRTLTMKNQDMIDVVETILNDFDIEVEDGEDDGYMTVTYEVPIK